MHKFTALPTALVHAWREGAPDAYGASPERHISNGNGNPCRHCLQDIPKGAAMLVLAHRPFDALHAYAETGPIFVCADPCTRNPGTDMPQVLTTSPDYLIKGYSADERIIYGTGEIVGRAKIKEKATAIFADPKVAFIHIRSARNNCYQARIDRT